MNDNTQQTQSSRSLTSSADSGNGKAAADTSPVSFAPSHEEIALRAFEIYELTGRRPGCCHDNWEQAENELRRECEAKQVPDRNTLMSDQDEDDDAPHAVRTFPHAIDAMLRSSRSTQGVPPQKPDVDVRADS